ncbi:MAG: hypothetical protein IKF72_12585 [Kiritimatiellae bacterium]|nr:hypothetical protein [Kiritimatiellia bacterium]
MKMQKTFKVALWLLSALMATLIPTSVDAGLKYWTTGRYDADSYVQDGLVLNYDGIRNVGIDQPHSMTTTTWVNLANPGTQDLTKGGSGKNSKWLDDGFFFDGTNWFGNAGVTIAGPRYTTQTLIDAKVSDHAAKGQIGYVFFTAGDDNKNWTKWSLAIRSSTADGVWFNTHYYTSDRPKIKNTDAFTYLTMIANDTYAAIFSGLTEPTGATGRYGLKSGTTAIGSFTSDKWGIGGNPGGGQQQLIGTIKSFRHYSRVLSLEERTWNRAVDDHRFFGIPVSTIPVTNAVIASSVAIVPANEAAGAYAVDAGGYTFTAPASQTVNGRAYTCTGYTLETWNDAAATWGNAQTESGTSVAVTASDRVRITWQWTAGDGIVTRYTTADYVQDGLLFHYDGICNVGEDQPHSADATEWKNLAPNGGFNMNLHVISMEGAKPGEWRADGYRFENESYFAPNVAVTLPSNQTIQVAMLGTSLDQYPINASGAYVNEAYIYYNKAAFEKGGALSLRKDVSGNFNSWIDWATHGYDSRTGNDSARPDAMTTTGVPFEYVTAVIADDFTADFLGTTIPTAETSRWTMNASRRTISKVPQVQTSSSPGFGIGGSPNDDRSNFRGVIKNFRFYNRVLTDEELAHNRVIDEYRFHGVIPVTNVIVTTSHSFFAGNEANGNYEISGTYTFSAPTETQTDSRGIEYTLDGYTIETWDAIAQGWSAPVSYESGFYTYTVGTSPAKVRLTWQWKATKGLRTAADYGLEDVVPNGLLLHYDGIKNIGAECADVTNPTNTWSKAWVNLADSGRYNLVRVNKTTKAGEWTFDGFAFTNTSSTVGSRFDSAGPFTLAPSYSLQVLLDATASEQADATCGYMMFNAPWKSSSIAIRTATDYGANGSLYYVADNAFGENASARPRFTNGSRELPYTYATAIIDGEKAMFFDGTDYPTSGTAITTKTVDATAQPLTKLHIGGGQGNQDFTGIVKSIRYYDRVLTTDEMVRNRNVDSVRYFGALATTNVFVVAGGEGAVQAEQGAYKVEGEWTFTATKTVNKKGEVVDVVRYSTEELVNGVWTNKTYHNGNTYTYTEGVGQSPSLSVRLTWLGQPLGTVILVQ